MDVIANFYWSRRIWTWLIIVIGVSIRTNAQIVKFSTFTTTVIVGQEVYFACTSDNFNPHKDRMEILFENNVLALYKNENFTFYKKDNVGMYESDILIDGMTSTPVGIAFIIKDIHHSNGGKYQCIMTVAENIYSSHVIDLSVKHIPKPTCSAIVDPAVIYFQEGRNAFISVHDELNVNITLMCGIVSTSDSVQVALEFVKSPNRTSISSKPSTSIGSANISTSISSSNNNITYTCIAHNSTYRSFREICSIKIGDFNEALNSISLSTTNKPTVIFENRTNSMTDKSDIHDDDLSEAWATIIAMLLVVGVIAVVIIIHSKKRTRLKRRERRLGHNAEDVVENPYYSSRISVLSHDAKDIDEGIYLDPIASVDHIYEVLEPETGECVRNSTDIN